MLKKILAEIQRLENLKAKKTTAKENLENEISDINAQLKKLNDVKKKFESIEADAGEILTSSKEI